MTAAPPPYTPSIVHAEALDGYTVGNQQLIEAIVAGLVSSASSDGSRFEVILGPSGSGKTHVLRSVYQRAKVKAKSAGAQFIMLRERALVASTTDLLARIVESLIPSTAQQDHATRKAKRHGDGAFAILESRIVELLEGKPLLLFVEQLGDVLDANVQGQHRMRALLQHQRNWSVVTTGMEPNSAFISADAPLFGMFALRRLRPLTTDECHELRVRRREGTPPTATTTRALHHLLGGWPRPMVIAQQHTAAVPDSDIGSLILALCDALEPELDCVERHLPHGRRSVFRAIANTARSISPSEIGESVFGISREAASAQLKILRTEGLVRAHTVLRSSYYELAHATHQLVATRRAQPDRLVALARFLRAWYADDDDADSPLGGRRAHAAGDALLALDLPAMAGLDRDAVNSIQRVLQTADRVERRPALRIAKHAHGRCSAPARRLLDQCLAGLGQENLL